MNKQMTNTATAARGADRLDQPQPSVAIKASLVPDAPGNDPHPTVPGAQAPSESAGSDGNAVAVVWGQFLTFQDVQRSLRISRTTLWRWINERGLKVVQVGGVQRIRQSELDRFTSRHEAPGGSAVLKTPARGEQIMTQTETQIPPAVLYSPSDTKSGRRRGRANG